jgi:hypothetical protein
VTLRTGAKHTERPAAIQPLTARAVLSAAATPRNWFAACPADGELYGNGACGDCVPVADFRYIQTVLASVSSPWAPTLDAVLGRYTALTGFDPATGRPDDGTDTAADLTAWCRDGIALPDLQRVIVPVWASVDPKRLDHVAAALALAPCLVSLNLPTNWQNIENDKAAWWDPPGALTGDFHRVLLGNSQTLRTWGMDVVVGPVWWETCVVAVDFLAVRDLVPAEALDWEGLLADAKGLT